MCTRAVYLGIDKQVVTGRSMDWFEDMHASLYQFNRGLKRKASDEPNALTWTSKYGSVGTAIYEGAIADGMNEKGLTVNMLFLAETTYPSTQSDKPFIYISSWACYVLDNFASVAHAVEELSKETFIVKAAHSPSGIQGNVHLALSDPSGDSAILEYLDGKLSIHHGKQYQILTNSPNYDDQLAIAKYWAEVGSNNL
ncbi:MAG: linear amide C-N hydrolase, partial [Bacilli bacterium]